MKVTQVIASILLCCLPTLAFGLVEITDATLTIAEGTSPPLDSGAPVELPYMPRGDPPLPPNSIAWFRIEAPAMTQYDEPVLYIWRHNVSATIYLNGERIGGASYDGRFEPMGWNHPLLLSIPGALLQESNEIHVRLRSGDFGGVLSSVVIGERSELQPLFEERRLWQVETGRFGFLISGTMGLFTLLLWLRRRQDTQYLVFTGASLSYAVIALYMFLPFYPFDLSVWLGIIHTAGTWSSYFVVTFILMTTRLEMPHFRRGLLMVSVIATLLHFIYPRGTFFLIAYGFHMVSIGSILFIGVLILIDSVRSPGRASSWIAAGYIGVAALVAHDIYFFMMSPQESYARASNLTQLGIPLLLMVLFIHLVGRFVRALDEAESLNRDLEGRVEANRRALEASYEENRRMELLESAAKEREKIYRDLHDDVGSKLVNIVHASDSERDVALARSALESLRESIYRANYQEQPASRFIADLKDEIEVRTGNAGLHLDWQEQFGVEDHMLDAELCFHVSRICRELVSNILHHSHASHVAVDLTANPSGVHCRIEDDGIGMGPIENCSSNGIKNIRHRIDTIGGDIKWQSESGQGTTVQFSFPLSAEVAPHPDSCTSSATTNPHRT